MDPSLYICLDEPHRTFRPGERICGRVVLLLRKPARSRCLSLQLVGDVSVSVPRSSRVRRVFLDELLVLAGARDGRAPPLLLEAAEHVFAFAVALPARPLPPSLQFGKGAIAYSLRCTHRRPWRPLAARRGDSALLPLAVAAVLDIAPLPPPPPKLVALPPVHARVALSAGALLRGDALAICVHISHARPLKNLRGIIVTLYRLSRIHAKGTRQSYRKDLAQVVVPLFIDPKSLDFSATPRIRLPADVFPTIANAPLASFSYFCEIVVDLSGKTTIDQSDIRKPAGDQSDTPGDDHCTLDTDRLRRERGVHTFLFEVVVGTVDSLRNSQNPVTNPVTPHMPDSPDIPVTPDTAHIQPSPIQPPQPDTKAQLVAAQQALLPSAPPCPPGQCHPVQPSVPANPDDFDILSQIDPRKPSIPQQADLRSRASAPLDPSSSTRPPDITVPAEEELYLPAYEPRDT